MWSYRKRLRKATWQNNKKTVKISELVEIFRAHNEVREIVKYNASYIEGKRNRGKTNLVKWLAKQGLGDTYILILYKQIQKREKLESIDCTHDVGIKHRRRKVEASVSTLTLYLILHLNRLGKYKIYRIDETYSYIFLSF